MKIISGAQSCSDGLNSIQRQLGYRFDLSDESQALGILQSLVVESFAESNPENQTEEERIKSKPLGLLAQSLVIRITADDRFYSLIDDPGLEAHYYPLLGCYGLVESMYIRLRREAFRIDTKYGGDWPLLLRAIVIPLSDQVFTIRQDHMVPSASAVLVRKLTERFKLFRDISLLPESPG
jgi:hypothetical protein